MENFDLVVVSHLRWDFVWQRPQQLLSRLAEYHRILFIEEPVHAPDGVKSARMDAVMPNIWTLTPQIPEAECGDTPLWLWPCRDIIATQVRQAARDLNLRERALWLYTPTPEFLADVIKPDMLVYDVMDELANFKFAPPQMKENELRFLGEAAVVFTGGASMYESKKNINPNTHLFASGVDIAHFASASLPDTQEPEWMTEIPSPRAAYIGVIDERLDYEVIAKMAQDCPHIQFLMCGPVVKVDPAHLPQAPNLHYPGMQAYADLPRILKGCDLCLMPFAQNDATRYISPTKTLEYMATHRPVVSTPIADVARFYSDIIYLGETPEQFVEQIALALEESPAERARKNRMEERILTEQSWDAIVKNMETLMQSAWRKNGKDSVLREDHRAGTRTGTRAGTSRATETRKEAYKTPLATEGARIGAVMQQKG